jgi:hypothetical protein
VQGSAAKSTHAGIPWLRFIRERDGQRVHFWPFDGWDIPAGRSVIAEVYPALWGRCFAREDRNSDQHDAYCIAACLSPRRPRRQSHGFPQPLTARILAQRLQGREGKGSFVTSTRAYRLLAFAPFDWIDKVDAAPIPVGVNFGATRHRQVIEQGGQGAFRTVHSQQLCPPEPRLPLALAASNLNHRTGLVCEPVMGFPSRTLTITTIQAPGLPAYSSARIS